MLIKVEYETNGQSIQHSDVVVMNKQPFRLLNGNSGVYEIAREMEHQFIQALHFLEYEVLSIKRMVI